MVIDFKDVVFKYVRIVGGVPSIDTDMTDAKFYTNKPTGYYRCFIFKAYDFMGISYEGLKNLVDIEEKSMWDNINRDTFLGYCETNNLFICNICGYMGLKDPDLKTDGSAPHSGQAGWYEMGLTRTSSDGIIKLKQTDNSDIYLKINDPIYTHSKNITSGNLCVVNKKKRVADKALFIKKGALWAKSSEDGSALMTSHCLPSANIGDTQYSYVNLNRVSKFTAAGISYFQSILYGKPSICFKDNTNTGVVSPTPFHGNIYLKNNTGESVVEYTETSDLNDILISGESIVFMTLIQPRSVVGCNYLKSSSYTFTKAPRYYWFYPIISALDIPIIRRLNKSTDGIPSDLISLDPKNKPFLYKPAMEDLLIYGFEGYKAKIKLDYFIRNPQEGFIYCILSKEGIFRIKKGEPIGKMTTSGAVEYLKITGGTHYPDNLYTIDSNISASQDISKDDLIAGTGFTDLVDTNIYISGFAIGGVLPLTIYKI